MNFINDMIDKYLNKSPWRDIYKERGIDYKIKIPEVSAYEYLRQQNENNMDSVAVNYFNKKMTFRYFFGEINLCARALKSSGIRPGDVVSICMANTPEAVIAFYACNKIGAIANMIHPLSAEEEIKQSLISTKSVLLITIDLTYSKVKNVIDETNVYKAIIVSPGDSMPLLLKIGYNVTSVRKIEQFHKSEAFMSWSDFMARGKTYSTNVLVKTTPDTPAVIMHSGGTTGVPKNIVLTNKNINSMVVQVHAILPDITEKDSMLVILPLFHVFGLIVCVHCPLCLGSSVILVPRFDAKRFDKLFSDYHPTMIAGVPTLFEALLSNTHMKKMDLSYLHIILSGGDTLSVAKHELVNTFFEEHGSKAKVLQGYGMTETSGCVTFGAEPGSLGIPFPGNEIKIVDPNTREELPPDTVGEMCICGPVVSPGYLDNDKETNIAFEKDKKGKIWVHTGDLGRITEDKIIYFVQRLKRMLIVSGYNVYPSHIEEVLLNHPDVLNVGVIGIPHPYKVQVPKAFIVLKSGIKPTPLVKKNIKDYCEKNLAKYMIPKEFVFRESLPKTMVGKVNYRELEEEENTTDE